MNDSINIYLDIDGVLLTKYRKPTPHVEEFLEYILTKFPESTYWLTTHCQGDARVPMDHISHLFSPRLREHMQKILPTQWGDCKTDAIDFNKPFLWFDDTLFYGEKTELEKHSVLENWIQVDLRKNEFQLLDFIASFPVPVQNVQGDSE